MASLELRDDGFLHRRIDVGEVRLHVAEARPNGDAPVPDDVPLVVLLHGFPELYWSWRHQLRALSAAGFWAVAPDMRGYNESDKPEGVAAYALERLCADVAGLIAALGRERAIVVGHDWGGAVAWYFAQLHAPFVSRLAILNAAHPVKIGQGMKTLKQLKKSWYMFFFQLPAIPEKAIASGDFATMRKGFASDGIPEDEIEPYVAAMRVPGALTAALNYYRSSIRRSLVGSTPKIVPIECPVLVIWGDQDRYLGIELAAPPPALVPHAEVVHIPEATHWVQNTAPDRVNELLIAFARGERG
ncbi:MAG: alpha/beta fold hydrolase [Labilithrix sp.]|nr:alpha/beta fold hydrolase [Labilithrix sp.]